MTFSNMKFEMEYKNPENNNVLLYFKSDAWQLYDCKEMDKKRDKYPDANGILLCLKFKSEELRISECAAQIAPVKNDIPYEWIEIKISGEQISTLLDTYEKRKVN